MVTPRQRSRRQKAALSLCLGAGIAAIAMVADATEVYRWVDAEGTVHFGDRPPMDRPVEQIEILAPAGALPLPDAEEILRRPVRPEDRPETAEAPGEDSGEEPEPEVETDEPEEFVRDRRSFRGR
ncbi:MAG: DUF4124 domain-containing protein [Thioalkalivibrio sp.]|nr:DUF4124 domain-containing protein [Thioalkalivibrio sp.]